ncbi:fused PTS fructose transporter subunit IIA/HPr protein [Vibrio penaeicida]|uniref:Multiphosphoryl transfer protein n=1 Tax=Vibrio penaeicida TaxID=104609 RepID=A0AAV5NRC4_9VIBR|nr:fused PTS fructose transporter subunit IIA/HPr protein [Vibrio penaeicida]RTZ21192.1 fused PTS fructose transporter subunit IIA/HPr protein [Vibrio penaeicida]GLQ72557.1 bifunctional PTS fructose transporter subunit IIA/HPr protein [Vibrio penaeicida]
MLTLKESDITLGCQAGSKPQAIQLVATTLNAKELVESNYVKGMLERESQSSTYLGNGIAIPHGTTDTRKLVKKTGVSIHHFPQGVDWGNGNIVYLAIGIAAKSDEHLSILKQLTNVLSEDDVQDKLRVATKAIEILDILNGKSSAKSVLEETSILIDFPATDMVQLTAVTAGILKNQEKCSHNTISDLLSSEPAHLGQGLWMASSSKGVLNTGLSFVSVTDSFTFQDKEVKALIAVVAIDESHIPYLTALQNIIERGEQSTLSSSSASQVLGMLSSKEIDSKASAVDSANELEGVFKIRNEHGLHARPGAMLVAEAKKFESTIKVENLNGDGKPANAKSLMKVIALGVKRGNELKFTASGPDAQQALDAIGVAIESGLGEG